LGISIKEPLQIELPTLMEIREASDAAKVILGNRSKGIIKMFIIIVKIEKRV
jgi:hypothetical protein